MTTATLYLLDEIGPYATTADSFVRELRAITASQIDLVLSTPGGDLWDALAIHNSLRDHPARVVVQVDALAASSGSVVAMAGDVIRMNRGSQMMIHEASAISWGSAEDMRSMASLLDRASTTIASLYATRAGGSVESWRQAMIDESWYSGPQAVAARLADEAVGEPAEDDWDATVRALLDGQPSNWAAMTQRLRDSIGGESFAAGFSHGQRFTDARAFGEHVATGELWRADAAHARGRQAKPPKAVPPRQRTTPTRARALLARADQLINPRQEN